MLSAREVTNTFLDFYIEYDVIEKISNLVAQKLNYLANGYWLVIEGERLISESFEAWNLGPVIPELYHELKIFGRNHIDYLSPFIDEEDLNDILIIKRIEDEKIRNFIEFIFNSYKDYTPGELVDLTHKKEGAWYKTINKEGFGKVIEDKLIKEEFKNHI